MGKVSNFIYRKGDEFAKIAYSALRNGHKTIQRIGRAFSDTIKEHDGFSGLINRLGKVFSRSVIDAKRIARTETTKAENEARYNAGREWQRQSEQTVMKTWICTFHNSRDSHIALHGVTIPMDEDFEANGGPMAYPGDGSRVGPEEICNCQCYLVISKE